MAAECGRKSALSPYFNVFFFFGKWMPYFVTSSNKSGNGRSILSLLVCCKIMLCMFTTVSIVLFLLQCLRNQRNNKETVNLELQDVLDGALRLVNRSSSVTA